MLPERQQTEADVEPEIFEDLDGIAATEFQSKRADPSDADEDDVGNILSDTYDDADEDDDDAPLASAAINIPPVADDVKEVLQSEAAFSSARAKLDLAAAATLDGRDVADDPSSETDLPEPAEDAVEASGELGGSDEIPDDEPADQAEAAPNLDDLAAFLDAHSDPVAAPVSSDPEPEPEQEPAAPDEPQEDPLADLAAMRAQLDQIAETEASDEAPEYTPVVPQDDPVDIDPNDFDDDDFDDEDLEDQPRHAFRSDRAGGDISDEIDDLPDADEDIDEQETVDAVLYEGDNDLEEPEGLSAAIEDGLDDASDAPSATVAALGMTRPRASGARRSRAFPGMAPPEETSAEPDDAPVPADTPDADDKAQITERISRPKSKRPARSMPMDGGNDQSEDKEPAKTLRPARDEPDRDRSEVLGDVDELSDSLGSTAAEPRPRDLDLMEAHEAELAAAKQGRSFRSAFIWTLFIFALLIALYVFRPQIVAALPPAAAVLDPYAGLIDAVRLSIQGLLG
ncbi:MAG: hypothetical protein AAF393_06690 [Pseudomonadota bacterium]